KRSQITKVGQILEMSEGELLALRNFGHKSLAELRERLESLGVSLESDGEDTGDMLMDIPDEDEGEGDRERERERERERPRRAAVATDEGDEEDEDDRYAYALNNEDEEP